MFTFFEKAKKRKLKYDIEKQLKIVENLFNKHSIIIKKYGSSEDSDIQLNIIRNELAQTSELYKLYSEDNTRDYNGSNISVLDKKQPHSKYKMISNSIIQIKKFDEEIYNLLKLLRINGLNPKLNEWIYVKTSVKICDLLKIKFGADEIDNILSFIICDKEIKISRLLLAFILDSEKNDNFYFGFKNIININFIGEDKKEIKNFIEKTNIKNFNVALM